MHVFLSYSRRDKTFVQRLATDLADRGIDVWLDTEDLAAADEDRWRRSIVQGIRESSALVVVLSPDSVRSEHVERELTIAAEAKRRIIPVVLRVCELPDGFLFDLAGVQRIDFAEQPHDDALDQLVRRIGPVPALAPAPPPPPPPPAATPALVGSSASTTQPGPQGSPPARPAANGRAWKQALVVVAGVVVLGIVGVIAVAGGGGGEEGDATSLVTTTAGPTGTDAVGAAAVTLGKPTNNPTSPPPDTDPTVDTQPTPRSDAAALALVDELEGAYNARDWDTVRQINTNHSGLSDEQFLSGWGSVDGLPRLEQAHHRVLSIEQTGTTSWRLVGVILAWDLAADGSQNTNVACAEWAVDTEARTAVQSSFEGSDGRTSRRLDGWIPADQFDATAAQYCR